MNLEKYSLGIGDRFGREGAAQLRALQAAGERGVKITPVWNKSQREHVLIGTTPTDARRAADEAVRACGWKESYFVDADHIGATTVDRFIEACDFFTIDVADEIGREARPEAVAGFKKAASRYLGPLHLPRAEAPLELTAEAMMRAAGQYLAAVEAAALVYRRIAARKGAGNFITEISFDESAVPQTAMDLYFILAALSFRQVAVQTIAPRFPGSFLKGIDYEGDSGRFARQFETALAVVKMASLTFDLPKDLKLSLHSGSDKFTLYPLMRDALIKADAGVHLKTAGTTWLEEVIGLAASGGDGLDAAKEIYAGALARIEELARPYLAVIGIDRRRLPSAVEVKGWNGQEFVEALRHDSACPKFNPHLRQLVHIGYKIAAEMGSRFTALLESCRAVIEPLVTANLFERHIAPLFLGSPPPSFPG